MKRQHSRLPGLDELSGRILAECPHVDRIVPGRIKPRRGHSAPQLRLQYPTDSGLKCHYLAARAVQEVFLICSDSGAAEAWLRSRGLA
ncbi:MAG: DUF2103 domain-containing protein [Phycisphaerales bacterium]|nr:DUF2103 domain-containing protein [Phycisphaerales bacterium]